MKSILVNNRNGQVIICVIEDEKIYEKYVFSSSLNCSLGNIYACKVEKVMDGMQAAFVDIGEEKKAFISLKDALPKVDVTIEKYDENVKMSGILKEGQTILAQVKKAGINEKGARISTHITLPGKYVVLMPRTNIITVSQKIEFETEKNRLKEIVKEILPKDFGVIIRTEAEGVRLEEIEEDIKDLLQKWNEILKKYESAENAEILYSEYDVMDFLTREIIDKKTNKIYINDAEIYENIKNKISPLSLEFYENEDLFEKFGLISEYTKIDDKKVWLKCGGYIVIDKAEALTAIDVNSGKYTGKEDLETTTYKVNVEAATEIMRQLRLKNISGIIVIDFIDMKKEEHREKILERLKEEAKKDRSKVLIYEFTKLNLVEITRKKVM